MGDPALGEWTERGRGASHLRRRLSAAEAAQTGPVRDIRGTPEALDRARAVGPRLAIIPAEVLAGELTR